MQLITDDWTDSCSRPCPSDGLLSLGCFPDSKPLSESQHVNRLFHVIIRTNVKANCYDVILLKAETHSLLADFGALWPVIKRTVKLVDFS